MVFLAAYTFCFVQFILIVDHLFLHIFSSHKSILEGVVTQVIIIKYTCLAPNHTGFLLARGVNKFLCMRLDAAIAVTLHMNNISYEFLSVVLLKQI